MACHRTTERGGKVACSTQGHNYPRMTSPFHMERQFPTTVGYTLSFDWGHTQLIAISRKQSDCAFHAKHCTTLWGDPLHNYITKAKAEIGPQKVWRDKIAATSWEPSTSSVFEHQYQTNRTTQPKHFARVGTGLEHKRILYQRDKSGWQEKDVFAEDRTQSLSRTQMWSECDNHYTTKTSR